MAKTIKVVTPDNLSDIYFDKGVNTPNKIEYKFQYSVANLKTATNTPPVVFITDDTKEGLFEYVSGDTSTGDDIDVIVTNSGKRYKRRSSTTTEVANKLDKGYSLTELRNLSNNKVNTIGLFYCSESGKDGFWRKYTGSTSGLVDNTGTLIQTSGGLWLERVIENYVNVTWFGAVGNSSYAYLRAQVGATQGNDDSDAIQKAINYCLQTGKPLFFKSGYYRITKPIVVTNASGITMYGEGNTIEISLAEYNAGIDINFKGVMLVRDYTGDSLFIFRGALDSSNTSDWGKYRDGKMWKTNIINIGFAERSGGTTNTSSLVIAKRSILMRFNNCLFLGASTSNFEGFLIDDSIFYDCRFISGGGRVASPNVLLHRITTISGETEYDATNSLYFIGCIWEGNRGQNLLVAPSNYTRADGTVFNETGSFAALQILGGVGKLPRLDSTCSTLNNFEFNNLGGAILQFGVGHSGNVDGSLSLVDEIVKFYNCSNVNAVITLEKRPNPNFNLKRFVSLIGGDSCNLNVNCLDPVSGITGDEAVYVTSSGGNNNEITGSVSVKTGSKRLTNKGWVKYSYSDSEPNAIEKQATIFFDSLGKFGWKKVDIDGVTAYINKIDEGLARNVTWTMPEITTKIVGEDTVNTFKKQNIFQGTIEALSGVGRGFWVKPTIKATANNDFLYGFILEPSFDLGSFTGIARINQIRLNGGVLQVVGSSANVEFSSDGNEIYLNGSNQQKFINAIGAGSSLNLRSYKDVSILGYIGSVSTRIAKFNSDTGSLVLQNGGAFADTGDKLQVIGDIYTTGKIKLQTGSNKPIGSGTLVAGTVPISNTSVTANSVILITRTSVGGTAGTLSYEKTAGVGFTVNSTSNTDTSSFDYIIFN